MGNGLERLNFNLLEIGGLDMSLVVLPLFAVILVVVAFFMLKKAKKTQNALNSAIVLVPLYKRKRALTLGIVIMFVLAGLSVYFGITQQKYVQSACLVVGIVAVIVGLISLRNLKFAVLDNGVILPYGFSKWEDIHDCILHKNTVIFTGNGEGRYTLSSTTVKMSFDAVDGKKLENIIYKNKGKSIDYQSSSSNVLE